MALWPFGPSQAQLDEYQRLLREIANHDPGVRQSDEYQRQGRLLMDQDAGVRQHALDALKAMGPAAITGLPAFIGMLNQQYRFGKEKCVRALSLIEPDLVDAVWSLVPAEHAAKKSEKTFRSEVKSTLDRLRNELT